MNNFSFRVPEKAGAGMPTYQQQQQYPTPGVDTSARLSDSAAQIYQQGADQQSKGLEKLGQGLEQASKAGYDLYTDYQTSKAKDAWLQYKQGADAQKAELNTLVGQQAIDKETGVSAQIEKWKQAKKEELTKNLGGMAKALFDRAASDVDSHLTNWGIGKTHGEAVNYGNEQSAAYIQLRQNEALANADNPAALKALFNEIDTEIKGNMAPRNGWDATIIQAKQQAIRQKTLMEAITERIKGEQLGQANALINAWGADLGGHANVLKAQVNAKGRELEARGREEKERNERKFSADFGNQLFSIFRLDAAGAQQQIEEKVKDPVLQERVFQSYLTRSAIEEHMQSKIAKQAQAADYNNAINKAQAILQDGEITDKATALSSVVTNIGDQETRKHVKSFVDDVLNGTESPYSKTVLAEAQEYAAQPGVTADMVTSKYKGQLPYSALQKATKTAESEQSKRSEQLMRDEITQILTDKYGFAQHQATAGYRTILSKITGITDPEQRLKMAREFTREISIKDEKSFNWRTGWFGGAKVPAYEFTHEQETSADLKVLDVPKEALPLVDAALRKKGLSTTDENRIDYYKNVFLMRGVR